MTLKEFEQNICGGRGLVVIECTVESELFRGKTFSKSGPLRQMTVQPWVAYQMTGAKHDFNNNPHWKVRLDKAMTDEEAAALNKYRSQEFRRSQGTDEPQPIRAEVDKTISKTKKTKSK